VSLVYIPGCKLFRQAIIPPVFLSQGLDEFIAHIIQIYLKENSMLTINPQLPEIRNVVPKSSCPPIHAFCKPERESMIENVKLSPVK